MKNKFRNNEAIQKQAEEKLQERFNKLIDSVEDAGSVVQIEERISRICIFRVRTLIFTGIIGILPLLIQLPMISHTALRTVHELQLGFTVEAFMLRETPSLENILAIMMVVAVITSAIAEIIIASFNALTSRRSINRKL